MILLNIMNMYGRRYTQSSPIKICFIRIIHNRRTALPTQYHVLVYAENKKSMFKNDLKYIGTIKAS